MYSKQLNKAEIIAEIGVNHNGKLSNAKKLILKAKKIGADYVKFQYFKAENIVSDYCVAASYQKKNTHKNIKQFDLLKKLELSKKQLIYLRKFSKKNKIKFMCSVFYEDDIGFVSSISDKYIKIPSGELTNIFLLRKLKNIKKKIILSTGASGISEIIKIIKFLKKKMNKNKKNLILMHCVTSYPVHIQNLNLNIIKKLKKITNLNVGFSDHSNSTISGAISYLLGARIIEKHLTLDNHDIGPDHKSSLNPDNFKKFVEAIRDAEKMIGKNFKTMTRDELSNKKLVRKYIVAKKEIKINEKFSFSNLKSMRTGKGNGVLNIFKIINKKSKKNYNKNEIVL